MEPSALQTYKCQNCGAEMQEALDGSFTCTHCGGVYRSGQLSDTLLSNQAGASSTTPADTPIPRDIALGYNKKRRLHPLLWGAIVWLIYGLLRGIFTAYLFENSVRLDVVVNNPLVSPIGGLFWIIRTILFLGILPFIIYLRRKRHQAF